MSQATTNNQAITNSGQPLSAEAVARRMAPFDVPPGAHIAVAVSGGPDSLALAVFLGEWAKARGVTVTALTVDHRLRAEARNEARRVHAWLAARGVAQETLTWDDGADVTTAVQARARTARYRLMATWCRTHGAAHLFAAHHLDDQAETVLMRLKRGSTLHGLAAMRATRDLGGGVTLCRPLLDVPKARLVATLEAQGQPWVNDPSNTDPAYERVRVRRLLAHLAADGVTAARLAGAARAAAAVTDVLDRAADAFVADHVTANVTARDGHGLYLNGAAFARLPAPVAARVLLLALRRVAGGGYPPAPDKLARLAVAMRRTGFKARTLGGCVVRAKGGGFAIALAPPRRAGGKTPRNARARGPKGAFLPPNTCPEGAKALHLCETVGPVKTGVPPGT